MILSPDIWSKKSVIPGGDPPIVVGATEYDWWRADDVEHVTNNIHQINQKLTTPPHGEDHKLVQSLAAAKPALVGGGQGGKSIARFTGAPGGDVIVTDSAEWATPLTQPVSILHVLKMRTTDLQDNIFDSRFAANRSTLYTRAVGGEFAIFAGGAETDWGSAVDTNFHWFGIVFNGASSVVYFDGVKQTLTANPGTDSLRGFFLNARYDANQNAYQDWYETRIWDGAVSDAEWEGSVQNYITAYYNFP